jgi:hypothetical protein
VVVCLRERGRCDFQPSRPATNVDATYLERSGLGSGPKGEVWSTGSFVSDMMYSNVFVAELEVDWSLPVSSLGYSGTVVVVESNSTGTPQVIEGGGSLNAVACGKWDFQVYSVSPVLSNGYAVIGEANKWVPVNNMRFADISYDSTSITASLRGVEDESVEVSWLLRDGGETAEVCVMCDVCDIVDCRSCSTT